MQVLCSCSAQLITNVTCAFALKYARDSHLDSAMEVYKGCE